MSRTISMVSRHANETLSRNSQHHRIPKSFSIKTKASHLNITRSWKSVSLFQLRIDRVDRWPKIRRRFGLGVNWTRTKAVGNVACSSSFVRSRSIQQCTKFRLRRKRCSLEKELQSLFHFELNHRIVIPDSECDFRDSRYINAYICNRLSSEWRVRNLYSQISISNE